MLDTPVLISAGLLTLGSAIMAVGGLWVTRGFIRPQIVEGHNEIAGFIFATLGVIYAVLLAFLVFAVWERFSEADRSVTGEAAAAVLVYRQTEVFPEPQRTQAQKAIRDYLTTGAASEWGSNGTEHFKAHTAPDPLNAIWVIFRQLHPSTPADVTQYAEAIKRLGDLEEQRHLRHLSAETSLSGIYSVVLVLGAVITVSFTYFFHIENWKTQSIMTAMLAALLGATLFLVWAQNEPFSGPVHVSLGAYAHGVEQLHSIDLGTAAPGAAPVPAPAHP